MRQRIFSAFALIIGLQLVVSAGAKPEEIKLEQFQAVSNESRNNISSCIDCGYTPDAPAHGDVPRCSDVLCLVQGLLDRRSLIYLDHDIDLSGTGTLPDVTSKLTVMGLCSQGSPCKIDAKGNSQIFVVGLNGYLTLRDLEITGGFCQTGGAITVSGSGSNDTAKGGKFVALNVKFTNNVAPELGGALNVESGGAAYIRDCVFQTNRAAKGGAIFVGSSKRFTFNHTKKEASCVLNSCTTVVNTEFSRNSADFGGAVYVDDATRGCKRNGGAKFDCTTAVFRDNSAQKEGGALFINFQSAGAISYLRKSRFGINTAEIYGGDIAAQQGEYGARGAQLYAYQVVFSGSKAAKGSAVAIKPFSFSTFAKCEFYHGSELQCEGSCDTFCPTPTPLLNGTEAYGATGESCPVSPSPLCGWVPVECQEAPPSFPPFSASTQPPAVPPASPPVTSPASSPLSSLPPPISSPSTSPSTLETPSIPPLPVPSPSFPSVPSLPPASPPVEAPGESIGEPRFRGIRPNPPAPLASAGAPSYRHKVGGRHRHRNGSITGDPHFVGKHGERFDFHGKSDRDYCILSDRDFHINMHVFKGIHKRSTFISKIGVLFNNDRVLIDAQADKSVPRFENQWKVIVNKMELLEGHMTETQSGLKILHLTRSVQIHMLSELDLNVTARPAGIGRFGSGANYLDFQINQLKVSSSVHGVLGQTYRESPRTYQKMDDVRNRKLKRSRAAALFVDGSESDYLSSGVMAADCKFSVYMDQSQISHRIQRMVLEGAKVFLGKREEIVRRCTGFGHSLCLSGDENDED